ncbi:UNVERIFIED_CONTAM: hypothetical protein RMT77_018129 [Armadillidium vulgare]
MENFAYIKEDEGEITHRKPTKDTGDAESLGLKSVRSGRSNIPGSEVKTEGGEKPLGGGRALEGGGTAPNDPVNLQRRVGLVSGVALIVGTMIGSGIFVSPKGVLERTGSAGLSLIVWLLCGILSLLGALSYAELGTLVESSGGEYSYFLEGFKPKDRKIRWWTPLPAFLLSWVSIFLLKPSSLAIITLTSAEYIVRIFRIGCFHDEEAWQEQRVLSVKLLAATIIIIITFINSYSVKLATKVQNVFTAAKLIAILIIVVGGIVKLCQGNVQYLSDGFQGSTTRFGDIATAFYSGLWAYDGWNNLNYVTEELKNPYVNLPRSIIIGLPLVTACYILVNISYLAVMSTEELLASETVAVIFGSRVIGNAGEVLMIISVALSTFGSGNGVVFTSGRFDLVEEDLIFIDL